MLADTPPLLSSRAYEAIKSKIVDGTYPPGAFLSERSEAAQLGMSKTPIRAAFNRLEQELFVISLPQRGVQVRGMSPRDIVEYFDIRIAIEVFVMLGLSLPLAPSILERIEENLKQQQDIISRGLGARIFTQTDLAFHALFAQAYGNRKIMETLTLWNERFNQYIESMMNELPDIMEMAYQGHCRIVELLKSGKQAEAAQELRHHIDLGKRHMLLRVPAGHPDR